MNAFPWVINGIVEAGVSRTRLEKLLFLLPKGTAAVSCEGSHRVGGVERCDRFLASKRCVSLCLKAHTITVLRSLMRRFRLHVCVHCISKPVTSISSHFSSFETLRTTHVSGTVRPRAEEKPTADPRVIFCSDSDDDSKDAHDPLISWRGATVALSREREKRTSAGDICSVSPVSDGERRAEILGSLMEGSMLEPLLRPEESSAEEQSPEEQREGRGEEGPTPEFSLHGVSLEIRRGEVRPRERVKEV